MSLLSCPARSPPLRPRNNRSFRLSIDCLCEPLKGPRGDGSFSSPRSLFDGGWQFCLGLNDVFEAGGKHVFAGAGKPAYGHLFRQRGEKGRGTHAHSREKMKIKPKSTGCVFFRGPSHPITWNGLFSILIP